jgi:hypothetical protein
METQRPIPTQEDFLRTTAAMFQPAIERVEPTEERVYRVQVLKTVIPPACYAGTDLKVGQVLLLTKDEMNSAVCQGWGRLLDEFEAPVQSASRWNFDMTQVIEQKDPPKPPEQKYRYELLQPVVIPGCEGAVPRTHNRPGTIVAVDKQTAQNIEDYGWGERLPGEPSPGSAADEDPRKLMLMEIIKGFFQKVTKPQKVPIKLTKPISVGPGYQGKVPGDIFDVPEDLARLLVHTYGAAEYA